MITCDARATLVAGLFHPTAQVSPSPPPSLSLSLYPSISPFISPSSRSLRRSLAHDRREPPPEARARHRRLQPARASIASFPRGELMGDFSN
ncbi:hypothetical protein NL676_034538 [Syzygium grande]|nr:hypothetical protein NL676_034538 [Syzygium grande]